jgi:hypothetical protein
MQTDTTTVNDPNTLGHVSAEFLRACGKLTALVLDALPSDRKDAITEAMATGQRCGLEGTVDWTGHAKICYIAIAPGGERTFLAEVCVSSNSPTTVQTLQ